MTRAKRFYIIGGIFVGIVVLAFLVSLFWTPFSPEAISAPDKLQAPSATHLFGTDNFGRDEFSRCLAAAKYTLFISFSGCGIALILGLLLGLPAGYFGGITDKIIMLISNSVMCFPGILLALVAVAVFGPSLFNVIWALGLVFAPTFARVCRTGVIQLNSREYIMQAKVLKVSPVRIMTVHMLPNLLPQLLPAIVTGLANMTLFESGMSYLGLGVQPPKASYGKLLADSQAYLSSSPWLIIFPALMLIFYILGLYYLSEGVRITFSSNNQGGEN